METPNHREENEAYHLVVDLLDQSVSSRISRSDARTYLAIIMDNNSHRTICRLYLNSKNKYIGIISERKVETRTPISGIGDIAAFSGLLNAAARRYVQR
jgi:hypothetical protein